MRRWLVVGSCATLIGGGVVAQQAFADTSNALPRVEAVEKLTGYVIGDEGRRGLSLGDSFTFRSVMLDAAGNKIGANGGECAILSVSKEQITRANCTATYGIRGGQVMAMGFYDGRIGAVGDLAIVGGTGKYQGAKGVVRYTVKSGDTFGMSFRFKV